MRSEPDPKLPPSDPDPAPQSEPPYHQPDPESPGPDVLDPTGPDVRPPSHQYRVSLRPCLV